MEGFVVLIVLLLFVGAISEMVLDAIRDMFGIASS